MKSFFYSNSEALPCFILPAVIQTGHQHPEPRLLTGWSHANYLPLLFCKRSAHTLASRVSGMVNCAAPEPTELSPSVFQNKLIFSLAQRAVSPLATMPQTNAPRTRPGAFGSKNILTNGWEGAFHRHSSKPQSRDPTGLRISCQIQSGNWNSCSQHGPIHPNTLERYTGTTCSNALRLPRGAPCGKR